jgi:hypothetical protein
MKKRFFAPLSLAVSFLFIANNAVAANEFHSVLANSPSAANILYSTQIQQESKVENGVLYTRHTPGASAENAIAQLLAATLGKFDSRFPKEISPYWTFQVRLARVNKGSKWHSYLIKLKPGIHVIKRRVPTRWQSERVTSWSDVAERKVLVY